MPRFILDVDEYEAALIREALDDGETLWLLSGNEDPSSITHGPLFEFEVFPEEI